MQDSKMTTPWRRLWKMHGSSICSGGCSLTSRIWVAGVGSTTGHPIQGIAKALAAPGVLTLTRAFSLIDCMYSDAASQWGSRSRS